MIPPEELAAQIEKRIDEAMLDGGPNIVDRIALLELGLKLLYAVANDN